MKATKSLSPEPFTSDQPVILERPSFWGQAFLWLIIVVTVSGLIWAAVAEIDQAIPSSGRLKPQGSQKEVKAPVGGVVRDIKVENGDSVKKGQVLLTLDPTIPEAEIESLKIVRASLNRENSLYDTALEGGQILDPELQNLTRLRESLNAENEYLQARIDGGSPGGGGTFAFDINQRRLLDASLAEARSREASARKQIEELEEQRQQVRGQITFARQRASETRNQIFEAQNRVTQAQNRRAELDNRLVEAQERLVFAEQQIQNAEELLEAATKELESLASLAKDGAIPQLQFDRQKQTVLEREDRVTIAKDNKVAREQAISALKDEKAGRDGEILGLKAQVSATEDELLGRQSEIDRLIAEEQRIQTSIDRAREQLVNTVAASDQDVHTRIAENQKRIAEIDSQLSRSSMENKKQIAQIDSNLERAKKQLEYQEIKAPVDGVVFDLQPNTEGFVVRDTEPLLNIIPTTNLIASVYITNKDIGFVQEGMTVEVSIAAFPNTEFGTIPGTLTSVGDDVLPPIRKKAETFMLSPLRSNSNRNISRSTASKFLSSPAWPSMPTSKYESAPSLSIFTDLFLGKTKSLETVR